MTHSAPLNDVDYWGVVMKHGISTVMSNKIIYKPYNGTKRELKINLEKYESFLIHTAGDLLFVNYDKDKLFIIDDEKDEIITVLPFHCEKTLTNDLFRDRDGNIYDIYGNFIKTIPKGVFAVTTSDIPKYIVHYTEEETE